MVRIICEKCGSSDIEADPQIKLSPIMILQHVMSGGGNPPFDSKIKHTLKCRACGNVMVIEPRK